MENRIGRSIRWLQEVDSTNDELARLLGEDPAPEQGLVIVASEQRSGKGLASNRWMSEPGKNLTFSYLIHPGFLRADQQFYLNIAVSLGVHRYLETRLAGQQVSIKWPNDIYVGTKKIGGILIQHAVSGNEILHSIIGIGLNVNQEIFPPSLPNPVSIIQLVGIASDLQHVLDELLTHLNDYYLKISNLDFEGCRTEYRKALLGYYKWLTFKHEGDIIRARIIGVSETGLLKLESSGKKQFECDMKEIEFLF